MENYHQSTFIVRTQGNESEINWTYLHSLDLFFLPGVHWHRADEAIGLARQMQPPTQWKVLTSHGPQTPCANQRTANKETQQSYSGRFTRWKRGVGMDDDKVDADLREAHCGFGFPQSIHFLLSRSSRLINSCKVLRATAWSIVRREGIRCNANLKGAPQVSEAASTRRGRDNGNYVMCSMWLTILDLWLSAALSIAPPLAPHFAADDVLTYCVFCLWWKMENAIVIVFSGQCD